MKTKRKPNVRFSGKVKKFVVEKMCLGMDISQIADKWPDKVPTAANIYREIARDPVFAEETDRAYAILLMIRLDELHKVSNSLASEVYPDTPFKEAEAALKRRMDAAKFTLGKMAPILSAKFNRTEKVEVEHRGNPQIAVLNYYSEPNVKQLAQDLDV